ncbi:MAG: hypothetical protein A3J28_16060 [Acidobacteria bacterium RIFCSPLOWO2_12_FULL_60_22]|nr:MAG: hypothetical protein A3J28_16060 [Acidobacteria bacterium RIFCSPLOWO2_12_FULL_60_22]
MNRMWLSLFFVLWGVATLPAQVVTGSIEGRVTDTTGAVVPGATVQVQNLETGFSRTVQGDSAGRYAVRNLPLGTYSVTGQMAGFRTEVRSGITLTVGREAVVNLELSVGTVQERVEVVGEAPLIETTTATVSGLVGQEQMRELPLNGRSFDQLALLQSGVIAQPFGARNQTQGQGLRLSSAGGRADSNSYLLDGSLTNDHSSQGPGSAAGQSLGVEAVREFRILTHNFSAEYGRNSGAVVSAVTRSGTNEFHGSVYEFLRNNVLDARDFFNPSELPPFRRNQFGASAGGPVLRDRIFFFANYEGLRERRGVTVIANVPDAGVRQGLIPNPVTGQVTQVAVSPNVRPYLDLIPLPNGRNFGDGIGELVSDFSSPKTENYSMQRMDFRLSDKDSFYWRYVFNPSDAVVPRPNPTFIDGEVRTNHFVALSETHIFSGAALNEFRFGFNRTDAGTITGPLDFHPELAFAPGRGFGTIRFRQATGQGTQAITEFGTSGARPQFFPQNLFQLTDTFSYIQGAHTVKFGADFQRIRLNTKNASRERGEYQFTQGLPGFLAGRANRLIFHGIGPMFNGTLISTKERGWRRILFGWFVQDDIRVSSRLTLNLGFRHEFFTSPVEVNGRSGNLIDVARDAATTPGPPFQTKKALFAPRLGVAWDPTGSGKTSIRGGAGLFYNHVDGRTFYGQSGSDACCRAEFDIRNPSFFPFVDQSTLPAGERSTGSVQNDLDAPSVVHYSLEIQRELVPTVSVRAGFIGSHGYNMANLVAPNLAVPQILADGTKFFPANAEVHNPAWSEITQLQSKARSNYNSFQLEIQKAFSRGLQMKAAYTYGKNLANADSISTSQILTTPAVSMDPFDLDRDYGRSVYDQRHTWVLNGRYQMPWDHLLTSGLAKGLFGGWAVNGIFQYGSGFPSNIQLGFNRSRDQNTEDTDRPDLAPGAGNDPHEGVTAGCPGVQPGQKLGTPDRWFDPCVFTLPAVGTYGNLARNTVTGPNFVNVDMGLTKDTPLGERMSLQFRAEFFNIINHANFGRFLNLIFANANARNGNAGRINETVTHGREIQFGLKLTF